MARVSIKTNFIDGDKLFAQQLNNNFKTIEEAINDGNKIVWQDGTEVKFKRYVTNSIDELPIMDGSIIYDTEKGRHYIDYEGRRIQVGSAGKEVLVQEEQPTEEDNKIWIESDVVNSMGTEILNVKSNSKTMGYSANYLNDRIVKVGTTEPTNGEKVWIKRGRNLFDIRKMKATTSNGLTLTPDVETNTLHIQGTPTGYVAFTLMEHFIPEHDFIVSLNGQTKGTANMMLEVQFYKDGVYTTSVAADYHIGLNEYDFDYCNVAIKRNNNVATDEDIQVLISYDNDPTFEPYIDKKIYTKNDTDVYEEVYDESMFSKITSVRKQKVNSTQGSWQNIPHEPGDKFLVSIIVGSNNSDVKNIPIDLIKKFDPSDPIKIIVNGTTITQLAWSGGNIVEYIWTSGYKVEHYTY